MDQRAFQDLVDWECFACGRLHEHGLKIKSYWSGDEVICTWQPDHSFVGHPGRVHAGLIATVMMCHVVWAATALAHRKAKRDICEPIDFTYGTKSFKLDLFKPFPIQSRVTFRAKVKDMKAEEATVLCSAYVDDEEHARSEALLFRFVPEARRPGT